MKSTERDSSGRGPMDRSLLLTAVIEKSRGLSLVWLIPLLALLIGIWLAYKTLSAEGPIITIHFKEAPGLEAGKSKIKFKDVEVGVVETVLLNEDLSQVIVTAKMEKVVAMLARQIYLTQSGFMAAKKKIFILRYFIRALALCLIGAVV